MIYLYRRGTRLGRIARRLGISVSYPYDNKRQMRKLTPEPFINWGCAKLNDHVKTEQVIYNKDLSTARSKIKAFQALSNAGLTVPRHDTDYKRLKSRLGKNISVLARRDYLSGGSGISILHRDTKHVDSSDRVDFFVERLAYQREFRVHVWNGEIIAEQIKRLPKGCTNPIHTFANGVTFTEGNMENWVPNPDDVRNLAVAAVKAVGLDFGAVDIFLNKKNRLYVLEVNSAPGIRADKIENAYTEVLKTWATQHKDAISAK